MTLNKTLSVRIATAAGLALGCAHATAQDSVANTPGLPGDAVSAYDTGAATTQRLRYVLDLAPLDTSWGGKLAIGPLAKSSAPAGTGVFGHLLGAQSASPVFAGGPLAAETYPLWNTQGQGINATANDAPADSVALGALIGQTLGAGFMEFGPGADGVFATGDDTNNIIALEASWIARRANRLYVTRTVGATNRSAATGGPVSSASFGLGAADAAGNVTFFADGYGMTSGLRIGNKRWYRVDAPTRNDSLVNQLANVSTGDAGATETLASTNISLLSPTSIPEDVNAVPLLIGTDFKSQLGAETIPGSAAFGTSHLSGGIDATRGPVSYSVDTFAPVSNGVSDAGIIGMLARQGGATRTRSILITGVDTDGAVDSSIDITLPDLAADMVDPTDGFRPADFGLDQAEHEFTNYGSQVSFRGGNGPVALGTLASGDLLVAAAATMGSIGPATPQGDDTYIAVAQLDTAGTLLGWTVAAHAPGSGGNGKAILGDFGVDGIPNTSDAGEGDGSIDATPVGRLAATSEVFGPGTTGPSMSSPAMDLNGNLYFTTTVGLNGPSGEELTTALVRANRDGAGAYTLELLMRVGDVIDGENSATSYRIDSLGLVDGDSIASNAVWSSSISRSAITWADPADHPLGALLVSARITYDTNADQSFDDPEQGAGTEPDESYNSLLVVMPRFPRGDVNRDQGFNDQDFFDFVNDFFGGGFDYNSDGNANDQDFFDFVNDFFNP